MAQGQFFFHYAQFPLVKVNRRGQTKPWTDNSSDLLLNEEKITLGKKMVMGNEVTCCSTEVSLSYISTALHKSSPVVSVGSQVSSPQHATVRKGKAQIKNQAALLQFLPLQVFRTG